MRAVKQGLLWALAATTSAAAMAGTVHKVRFAQPAHVMVWEQGELIAQGPRVQLSGHADDQPAFAGGGIVLSLSDPSLQRKTVAVASNAPFTIRSSDAPDAGRYTVRVLNVRENASLEQHQDAGALFRQARKTAIRPGHPSSQAVELEISWTGEAAPNLLITTD